MDTNFEFSLNGMQRAAREEFNELVAFFNEHKTDSNGYLESVRVDELDILIRDLRQSIILFCGIIDPMSEISGIEGLEDVDFKVLEHEILT